jgi:hypothetical protein
MCCGSSGRNPELVRKKKLIRKKLGKNSERIRKKLIRKKLIRKKLRTHQEESTQS